MREDSYARFLRFLAETMPDLTERDRRRYARSLTAAQLDLLAWAHFGPYRGNVRVAQRDFWLTLRQ